MAAPAGRWRRRRRPTTAATVVAAVVVAAVASGGAWAATLRGRAGDAALDPNDATSNLIRELTAGTAAAPAVADADTMQLPAGAAPERGPAELEDAPVPPGTVALPPAEVRLQQVTLSRVPPPSQGDATADETAAGDDDNAAADADRVPTPGHRFAGGRQPARSSSSSGGGTTSSSSGGAKGGGGGGAGGGKGVAPASLPAWLEKPPYWLPTPPEWGPPPAHIFTSWYSPRNIPQPVFKPSPFSYAPSLYATAQAQSVAGGMAQLPGAAGAYVSPPSAWQAATPTLPWYSQTAPPAMMMLPPSATVLLELLPTGDDAGADASNVNDAVLLELPARQRVMPTDRLQRVLQLHALLASDDAAARSDATRALRELAQYDQ